MLHVPSSKSMNRVGLILIIPAIKVQGSVGVPNMHATETGCMSAFPATLCPHTGVPAEVPGMAPYAGPGCGESR